MDSLLHLHSNTVVVDKQNQETLPGLAKIQLYIPFGQHYAYYTSMSDVPAFPFSAHLQKSYHINNFQQ
jgi:hypothetical protein